MFRSQVITIVLMVLAVQLRAEDSLLKLPPEVKGEPSHFITIKAETNCKMVKWAVVAGHAHPVNGKSEWLDPAKHTTTVPMDLLKDSRALILIALTPGVYHVRAHTALADTPSDSALTIVVIGKPGPIPPPPPPGPVPPPDPPSPVDPLVATLQAAYAAEGDAAGKLQHKVNLGIVYMTGVNLAVTAGTWGELFEGMAQAANEKGVAGKLQMVQSVLQGELVRALPTDRNKPLDTAGRKLAGDTFRRISSALEKVK